MSKKSNVQEQAGLASARGSASLPTQDFVPMIGSSRWECMDAETQEYWKGIHATTCILCEQPIGQGVWMLTWTDRNWRAHMACHEDKLEAERLDLSNPHLMEEAAKAAQMTLEGFKALPTWERARRIREAKAARAYKCSECGEGFPTVEAALIHKMTCTP